MKTNEGVESGVFEPESKLNISANLDKMCSQSFKQKKIHAVKLCVNEIMQRSYSKQHINILSDSKAFILALNSHEIKSKLG